MRFRASQARWYAIAIALHLVALGAASRLPGDREPPIPRVRPVAMATAQEVDPLVVEIERIERKPDVTSYEKAPPPREPEMKTERNAPVAATTTRRRSPSRRKIPDRVEGAAGTDGDVKTGPHEDFGERPETDLGLASNWSTLLADDAWKPTEAPTATPRRPSRTGEEVTAMLERDLLETDAEIGVRQPSTYPIVAALSSELRMASLPDGARIVFTVDVAKDGAVVAIVPGAQSAGDGAEAVRVAAASLERLHGSTMTLGGYTSGARIEIQTAVVDAFPSGDSKPLALKMDCPTDPAFSKPRELRGFGGIIPWPFDPNQLPVVTPVLGEMAERRPKRDVKKRGPCFQPRGSFDVANIGAPKVRQVRTTTKVSALPG